MNFYCFEPHGGEPQFIELLQRPRVKFHLQLTPQTLLTYTQLFSFTHPTCVAYAAMTLADVRVSFHDLYSIYSPAEGIWTLPNLDKWQILIMFGAAEGVSSRLFVMKHSFSTLFAPILSLYYDSCLLNGIFSSPNN